MASAVGVWVTAIATLLASSPRVDCRCSNGHVKPFCLSFLVKSACCFDHTCCTVPARPDEGLARKTKKTCCCCRSRTETGGTSSDAGYVQSTGCQKTLVGAKASTIADSGRPSGQALSAHLLAVTPDSFVPLALSLSWNGRLHLRCSWRPPPADLVTLLLHFLIRIPDTAHPPLWGTSLSRTVALRAFCVSCLPPCGEFLHGELIPCPNKAFINARMR
jgi:hypothetical protein